MLQTVLMFLAPPQNVALDENPVTWLAIAGNALGFSLLMAGLWLILHLAEVLLA